MSERFHDQRPPHGASSHVEKALRHPPEPRSDKRPAGRRLKEVLGLVKSGNAPTKEDPKPEAAEPRRSRPPVAETVVPASIEMEDPPSSAEPSVLETEERGTKESTPEEDHAVVRSVVRELQILDKCPECFPLLDADLKRLEHVVHGVEDRDPKSKTFQVLVRAELEKIAAEKTPLKKAA